MGTTGSLQEPEGRAGAAARGDHRDAFSVMEARDHEDDETDDTRADATSEPMAVASVDDLEGQALGGSRPAEDDRDHGVLGGVGSGRPSPRS